MLRNIYFLWDMTTFSFVHKYQNLCNSRKGRPLKIQALHSSVMSLPICQFIRRSVSEDVQDYEISNNAQISTHFLAPHALTSCRCNFGVTLSKYSSLWNGNSCNKKGFYRGTNLVWSLVFRVPTFRGVAGLGMGECCDRPEQQSLRGGKMKILTGNNFQHSARFK